ncbi:MAG: hypothetical protein LBD23_10025 [Oscillospiraceae bacterium]|jgi:hypothetical protein|nr:hypothetical protein [Oscillospiraceae bacterium]
MNQRFQLSNADLDVYKKKRNKEKISNMQLRDENTSFFQAMLSDDANYIKKGVVKQDDIIFF